MRVVSFGRAVETETFGVDGVSRILDMKRRGIWKC